MKDTKHKTIGVRVPETMADELELLAKEQQRTVSNVIRMAIEAHLNQFFNTQGGETK